MISYGIGFGSLLTYLIIIHIYMKLYIQSTGNLETKACYTAASFSIYKNSPIEIILHISNHPYIQIYKYIRMLFYKCNRQTVISTQLLSLNNNLLNASTSALKTGNKHFNNNMFDKRVCTSEWNGMEQANAKNL